MPGKKTLLVVEDEASILLSVQRILELTGEYEVITATNGKDALKRLENIIPDLIISDIAMPEMDGVELCKMVRKTEITSTIPFIFLTAKRDRLLEGIQTGSDDYLLKPFQVDELIGKIRAMFRRIEMTREQAYLQKGDLSEYNFDEIFKICTSQAISGELVLRQNGDVCNVYLAKGEISKIDFKDKPEDKALDIIRKWKTGTFVLRSQTVKIKSKKASFEKHKFDSDEIDISEAVKIAEDTWWIGRRNPDTLLQINVYLRQFRFGKKIINYLIDPGSPVDFPVISQKLSSLIGDLTNLHVYSLNHQDPDVAMNSVFIKNINPKAICLTTEENWRLISHYDINPKSVKIINDFKNWRVKLATNHELIYVPSPFCHFKGAFLTYDPQTRVLFTGDLFAGINKSDNIKSLKAGKQDWDGVMAFHQLYMPSNKALRYTILQIKKLNPPPLIIAPQHGGIIHGEDIHFFMDKLYNLKVGADFLDLEVSPESNQLYIDAANEIIHFCHEIFSKDKVYKKMTANQQLQSLCNFDMSGITTIFNQPENVLERLVSSLVRFESETHVSQIKSIALKATVTRNLQAPSLDWDATETVSFTPKDIFTE